MTLRRTAQEHLDFWIEVHRRAPVDKAGQDGMIQLRRQSKVELRYWRRQVRKEYEDSLVPVVNVRTMTQAEADLAASERRVYEGG